MNSLRISRRDLTSLFVKGSFAYGLASMLRPEKARAAAAKMKRLVVISVPEGGNIRLFENEHTFGTLTDYWCPAGVGSEHPIDKLSPILAGFESLKSSLLVVDGLWNPADPDRMIDDGIDGHYQSFLCMITGNHLGKGDTLDQMLSPALKGDKAYLRDSVQLGIGNADWNLSRKGDQGLAGWRDPPEAFAKVFADFAAPTTSGPPAKAPFSDAQATQLLVDLYLDEYKTLRAQVGKQEQLKLDFNVESLSALQKRLAGESMRPPDVKCDPSAIKTGSPNQSMDLIAEPMMDIAAHTLACDITRVMSIQMANPYLSHTTYPWLGISDTHHTLSHQSPVHFPDRQDKELKIYRWYHDQIAYFANKLKSFPDPDGGSVLDNTVIVVVSEFGDGQHTWDHLPVLVIGGSAAGVRGGRVIHYSPNFGDGSKSGDCQPINRFWMTLANELAGQNLAAFGDAKYCTGGVLPGIL